MNETGNPARRAAALAVHLFTASGAAAATLALIAALEGQYPLMFGWLALCLFIDGVDGTLARAAGVKTHAARINGDVLDLVVDFLAYVFVPVVAIWRGGLLPASVAIILCPLVVMASAVYFADNRMKTADHWFRGFPALWNIAAFYLFSFGPPPAVCAVLVVGLTALMFAPFAFVHPVRVEKLRVLTVCVTMAWLGCAAWDLACAFEGGALAKAGLAVAGLYYAGLSLVRGRAS